MQDLKNLRERLAREEATLATTNQQIETALNDIGAAQRKIEDTQRQIEELRESAQAIEKRMELLRQYIDMVESGAGEAEPVAGSASEGGGEVPIPALPDLGEPEPDEFGDLSLGEPPPAAAPAPEVAEDDTISFETVDEKRLAVEILPRAQTFEEELLLLLAHHRKAIKPKDLARVLRLWDYTPRGPATEAGIKDQLDADNHFFEHVADGRYALTDEGREEALRLLEQLTK